MSEKVHVSSHPLIQHKVTLLSQDSTDTRMFRELVREMTGLLVYEAMADVPVTEITYTTPLEESTGHELQPRVGLVPIIRAGIGMVDAAVDMIPSSEVWHLGMYRDEVTHTPVSYYNKLPKECPDDLVVVLDPMLATGGSARDAITVLKDWGAKWIKFVGIIAAPEGIAELQRAHPDVDIYVARLDRELDGNKYIRPGLGDAGDRMYGTHAAHS
ncbi:MAG: uracil phosphoribosyltransferase [Thermomicrobiales bacterium]|nr:uracil phosphoribosyltransferase [Thermomicrobiales bacterium]MCO5218518.1 uracil phosphoribosyltransferase [Thermomicrobiales bacterium]MCO5224806.1 uracil phosphoribosyltransferase [Thermomicrobiales bacterium]MCO5227618.1 uracil phosphoribosyltransferase [Thermomicrobiales bacterium]